MKPALHASLLVLPALLLLTSAEKAALVKEPSKATTDIEQESLEGPVIERIDWEDKPCKEAAKELLEMVVKIDKTSQWRHVRIIDRAAGALPVTMHLRAVTAGEAFEALADFSGCRLSMTNGIPELFSPEGLDGDTEYRFIHVTEKAAEHLAFDPKNPRKTLQRFGIRADKEEMWRVEYSVKSRELLLKGPPGECDLAKALFLVAERTGLEVKKK